MLFLFPAGAVRRCVRRRVQGGSGGARSAREEPQSRVRPHYRPSNPLAPDTPCLSPLRNRIHATLISFSLISSRSSGRCGFDAAVDVGPLISPRAKERAEALIASGVAAGARCALDGRGVKVPGYEKGNFVGPTLLTVRSPPPLLSAR